jgi:tRNA wybutosine-synthesizing protein 3
MATQSQYGDATISSGFVARKRKILSDLSVPDAEYTDLSPKGSVDEGIRDLIRDINALDGLVTTSSCAGRVSIFVEGSKKTEKSRKTDTAAAGNSQGIEQAAGQVQSQLDDDGKIHYQNEDEHKDGFANSDDKEGDDGRKFALSGGKGQGRWLYVSHDPVDNNVKSSYHELFGLVPGDGVPKISPSGDANMRLIRFHYDPMVRMTTLSDFVALMAMRLTASRSYTL